MTLPIMINFKPNDNDVQRNSLSLNNIILASIDAIKLTPTPEYNTACGGVKNVSGAPSK
jgi:hypothetical protein